MKKTIKNIIHYFFFKAKKRTILWSRRLLAVLILVAVFANFIANEKPLYCQIQGTHYFPVFKEIAVDLGVSNWQPVFINANWQNLSYEKSIFPPIPYAENTPDNDNWFVSPFAKQQVKSLRFRHWLGTHRVGRDVAAGLVHGTRKALLVGLFALSIAALIGVFLGVLAGYFGDDKLRISWGQLLLNVLLFPVAIFYGFVQKMDNPDDLSFAQLVFENGSWFLLIMLLPNAIFLFFEKKYPATKTFKFPVDLVVMRLVEIMNSIPTLLLLLALIAVLEKSSLWHIAILIGLVGWTSLTRFTRGEILKIRELSYIEAAKSLGYSPLRIMLKHLLPNALAPLLIVLAFGMGGTILLEASLSFLGMGGGIEEVTWGKLLAQARVKPSNWWLTVFPGFAIFITVMIFNFLGENERENL